MYLFRLFFFLLVFGDVFFFVVFFLIYEFYFSGEKKILKLFNKFLLNVKYIL